MPNLPDKLSCQERAMFTALGMTFELDLLDKGLWGVYDLYHQAPKFVLLNDCHGPAVASLARCVRAFGAGTVYRLTPAWDALIELNTPS